MTDLPIRNAGVLAATELREAAAFYEANPDAPTSGEAHIPLRLYAQSIDDILDALTAAEARIAELSSEVARLRIVAGEAPDEALIAAVAKSPTLTVLEAVIAKPSEFDPTLGGNLPPSPNAHPPKGCQSDELGSPAMTPVEQMREEAARVAEALRDSGRAWHSSARLTQAIAAIRALPLPAPSPGHDPERTSASPVEKMREEAARVVAHDLAINLGAYVRTTHLRPFLETGAVRVIQRALLDFAAPPAPSPGTFAEITSAMKEAAAAVLRSAGVENGSYDIAHEALARAFAAQRAAMLAAAPVAPAETGKGEREAGSKTRAYVGVDFGHGDEPSVAFVGANGVITAYHGDEAELITDAIESARAEGAAAEREKFRASERGDHLPRSGGADNDG